MLDCQDSGPLCCDELMYCWLMHWFTDVLIDWCIDWLMHWLSNPLIDWYTDWLMHWLFDALIDWCIDLRVHCLTDALVDWCTNWLIDRWTDCLMNHHWRNGSLHFDWRSDRLGHRKILNWMILRFHCLTANVLFGLDVIYHLVNWWLMNWWSFNLSTMLNLPLMTDESRPCLMKWQGRYLGDATNKRNLYSHFYYSPAKAPA